MRNMYAYLNMSELTPTNNIFPYSSTHISFEITMCPTSKYSLHDFHEHNKYFQSHRLFHTLPEKYYIFNHFLLDTNNIKRDVLL